MILWKSDTVMISMCYMETNALKHLQVSEDKMKPDMLIYNGFQTFRG
jgi:hypothetical protein